MHLFYAVTTLLVLSLSCLAQVTTAPATQPADLADLIQERIKTAEKGVAAAEAMYRGGITSSDVLFLWQARLLEARTEAAQTPEEKRQILRKSDQLWANTERLAQDRAQHGLADPAEALYAHYQRLSIQIQLAELRSGNSVLLETKQAALAAAEQWSAALDRRMATPEGWSVTAMEQRCQASRDVLDAKLDLAQTDQERITALEAHTATLRRIVDLVEKRRRQDADPVTIAKCTYELKHAEVQLAKAREGRGMRAGQ